MTTQAMKGIKI